MPEKLKFLFFTVMAAVILATNVNAGTESGIFHTSMTAGGYSGNTSGTAPVIGIKFGYDIIGQETRDSLGIEGGFSVISAKSRGNSTADRLYLYRLEAIYPFMPRSRFVPYLAVGLGGLSASGGTSANNGLLWNYGIGIKYFLTEDIAIRADFRQLTIFNGGNSSNFEYTAGLTYYFNKDKQIVRIPVVPAPIVDSDNDGVPDDKDACPDTPRNVKVNADGCPHAPAVPKPAAVTNAPQPEAASGGIQVEEAPAAPVTAVAATEPTPVAVSTESQVAAQEPAPVATAANAAKTIEQPTGSEQITATVTLPPVTPATLPATPPVQLQPPMATVKQKHAPERPAICPAVPDKAYAATYADREKMVVEFASDSAVLKREHHAALKALRKRLKANSSLQVALEGHADYRKSPAYNLALSWRRAAAVKSFLIRDKQIAAARITIEAYGCTTPIDDNRTVTGRQKNRRAVVVNIKDNR